MREWLTANPPRLELATLALEELRVRDSSVLKAEMVFADCDLQPIDWLEPARRAVASAFPKSWEGWDQVKRSGGTVYVILRDGYSAESGFYGAYVGSTKHTLEKRFMEHRQSSKAGRGLPAHGIEPLFSLCQPFMRKAPLARASLEAWETRLHQALAEVIPKVSGDVVT